MSFSAPTRPPIVTSISVKALGARGDYNPATATGTDDRASFINAIAAAMTSGLPVSVPPGNYRLSKYVNIAGAHGLRIIGSAFSTIYYPSDDTNVLADATAVSVNEARSALLLTQCSNVTIDGLTFIGGNYYVQQVNIGAAVYARNTVGLNIVNCTSRYGQSLLTQDMKPNTTGTGTSLAVSAGVVTLTDTGFVSGHRGRYVTITNATNNVNNGVFEILTATTTTLTYANAAAIAETSSFLWSIDDADRETKVDGCRIESARGVLTPGPYAIISRCSFTQPMTPDQTGIGDSFTDDGATTTLRDANGTWDSSVVGRFVKIANAVSSANNGTYQITAATAATRYSPATLTYDNASGVTESTQRGGTTGATTSWWIHGGEKVGRGAGVGGLAKSGTTMTLTSATASFSSSDVGKVINVTGVTTPLNSSFFVITEFVSSTAIRYENTNGATEDYSGVWQIDGHDSGSGVAGTHGSSHAIYAFGGRHDLLVDACTFTGIRKTCVKVSGSSEPTSNIVIRGCIARECGTFTVIGADDTQRHDNISIQGNVIVDCGNGRGGWQDQVAIDILGASGVDIRGNIIQYTHNSIGYVSDLGSVSDRFAISAKRYARGYSQPLENVSIVGNSITADPRTTHFERVLDCAIYVRDCGLLGHYGTGGTLAKNGNTMTLQSTGSLQLSRDAVGKRILLSRSSNPANDGSFVILSVPAADTCTFTNASGVAGGLGAVGAFRIRGNRPHPNVNSHLGSYCRIVENAINAAGSVAIKIDGGIGPEIRGNSWSGVNQGVSLVNGVALPAIVGNQEGSRMANTASISLGAGTAWPVVNNNRSTVASLSGSESISNALKISDAGGTSCDYPLLGTSGRVRPSDAKEEIVIAYGGGFADGDYLFLFDGAVGTTLTYKASSPGAGQFNSFAGLVAAIDAVSGFDCADYGTGLSGGDVATQHLRIRATSTTAVDGTSYVLVDTCNPNSLVLLSNAIVTSTAVVKSRGGGSTGAVADRSIVWSQMCRAAGMVTLVGESAASRTLLAGDKGASGTITCVAKASMADTDYITIGDGISAPKLYEFDTAGDGVTGGRVQVNISSDTTAAQVAARLKTAIEANQPAISVTDNADGTLSLAHKLGGTLGNVTITENVSNAGFLVSGMSGGTTGGHRIIRDANDDGCCYVVIHGTTAGTEEFRWGIAC